jgi:hypothetical protein
MNSPRKRVSRIHAARARAKSTQGQYPHRNLPPEAKNLRDFALP